MKKQILSGLLSVGLCLCLCLLPGAGATERPDYHRPDLPEVYQGDGMYLTLTPIEVEGTEDWEPYSGDTRMGDGLLHVKTYRQERDAAGYLKKEKAIYETYLDMEGHLAMEPRRLKDYNYGSGDFHDGLACYRDQDTDLWGYMDKTGKAVILPRFYGSADFHNGYAKVEDSTGTCIIDTADRKMMDCPENNARSEYRFDDGLTPYFGKAARFGSEIQVGFMDPQGNMAITFFKGEYEEYRPGDGSPYLQLNSHEEYMGFSEGYAVVYRQLPGYSYPTYILIDTEGNEVLQLKDTPPYRLNVVSNVQNGQIKVERINTENDQKTYGVMDIKGNIVREFGPYEAETGNYIYGRYAMPGSADMTNEYYARHYQTGYQEYSVKNYNFYIHCRDQGDNANPGKIMVDVTMQQSVDFGSAVTRWYYAAEVHEGNYSGTGRVYSKEKPIRIGQNAWVEPEQFYPVPGSNNMVNSNKPSIGTETWNGKTVCLYPEGTYFSVGERGSDMTFYYVNDLSVPNGYLVYLSEQTGGTLLRKKPWSYCFPAGHIAQLSYVSDDLLVKNVAGKPAADQPSGWAKNDVDAARNAGIVPAAIQSRYTDRITRAEFCALACQTYETLKGDITQRRTFTDTTDPSVEKMAAIGVVMGVGDGTRFAPDDGLTREQAATMLARLADKLGKPIARQNATFADKGSVSVWAAEAVGQMQFSGIMKGVSGNRFDPAGTYTREQSILTALRLFNFVK